MGNTLVKSQLKEVEEFLTSTSDIIEGYLNETTLSQINAGSKEDLPKSDRSHVVL